MVSVSVPRGNSYSNVLAFKPALLLRIGLDLPTAPVVQIDGTTVGGWHLRCTYARELQHAEKGDLRIGNDVRVMFLEIELDQSLGIEAPDSIPVYRKEIYDQAEG